MPFAKYILEDDVPCPRCNGDSQIRVEDKEDICIIVHVCPYCRLHKVIGTTNRDAMKYRKREQELLDKLKMPGKIGEKQKILARLKKVQRKAELSELGIRRKHGRRTRTKPSS